MNRGYGVDIQKDDAGLHGMMTRPGNMSYRFDLKDFEEESRGMLRRPPQSIVDFLRRPLPVGGPTDFNWDVLSQVCRNSIYEYQREILKLVVTQFNGRALLAIGQGAGKTLLGSALGAYYKGKTAYIVIGGVTEKWMSEVKLWTGIEPQLVKTGKTVIKKDVVVISFGLAKTHKAFLATKWDTIIVDESHTLMNSGTIVSREITPLLRQASAMFLLSGTPLQSRPCELFPQLNAVQPEAFADEREFETRYCRGHMDATGTWNATGSSNEEELHLVLSQVMIRRRTEDVLPALPPKTRVCAQFSLNGHPELHTRSTLENTIQKDLQTKLRDTHDGGEKAELLKQVQNQANVRWKLAGEIKTEISMDWVFKDLQEHPQEKAIIFVKYVDTVARASKFLEAKGIATVCIDGKVKNRTTLLESFRFRETPGPRVAVLSLGTCSKGLDLQGVSRIYMMEFDAKSTEMLQAEARAHRNGVKFPVTVYYIVVDGTYDENSMAKMWNKSKISNQVVDGEDSSEFKFDKFIRVKTGTPEATSAVKRMMDASAAAAAAAKPPPPSTIRKRVRYTVRDGRV